MRILTVHYSDPPHWLLHLRGGAWAWLDSSSYVRCRFSATQTTLHACTDSCKKRAREEYDACTCACTARWGADDGTRCTTSRLWSAAFWGTRDDLLPWRLTQHPSPHGKTQQCHPVSAVSRFKLASLASQTPLILPPSDHHHAPHTPRPCCRRQGRPHRCAPRPPRRPHRCVARPRRSVSISTAKTVRQLWGRRNVFSPVAHYHPKVFVWTMQLTHPAPAPPWSPAPSTRRRSPPPPSSSRSPRWYVQGTMTTARWSGPLSSTFQRHVTDIATGRVHH